MKKVIVVILCFGLITVSCTRIYQKEIKEVEGLLELLDNTEEVLFSVDFFSLELHPVVRTMAIVKNKLIMVFLFFI